MNSKIPKLRKKTRSTSEKRKKKRNKKVRDTLDEDEEHEQVTKPSSEPIKKSQEKQTSTQNTAPQPPAGMLTAVLNAMSINVGGTDHVKKLVDWVAETHSNGGLSKFFIEHLANYIPPPDIYKYSHFSEHKNKNRYKDVVCLDGTRVKLQMEGYTSDYIHANHIVFPDFDRKFIATQYPLEETIEDFWRMVFDESVDTIIALCNPRGEVELKHDKLEKTKTTTSVLSFRPFNFAKSIYQIPPTSVREAPGQSNAYWPLKEGSYTTYGKFFVHTRKIEPPEQRTSPHIYTVEILPEGCSNCIFVKVINFQSWPKSNLPSSPRVVLKLIKKVREIDPLQSGPVVIHCDGGINRSAVVILTDVILTRVYSGKSVDIAEIFKRLRNQRASCIQSHFLFVYVFYCVTEYIRLRCIKVKNPATSDMVKQIVNLQKDFTKILKDMNMEKTHQQSR